jgi:hypothetical protein
MTKKMLMVLAGVSLLCCVLLFFVFWLMTPLAVQTNDLHVKVDDYVGINLDTDKLYFGTVTPGSGSRRDMTIAAEKGAFVQVAVEGPIAPWVTIDKTAFSLAPGISEKITFSVAVPNNTSFGNYTGLVYVRMFRRGAALFLE